MRVWACAIVCSGFLGQSAPVCGQTAASRGSLAIRVATFNIEDVRTASLLHAGDERLRDIAEVIQRLRPNVVLINEIAYDLPGAPDVPEGAEPGQNARRFVEQYLSHPQAEGLKGIDYETFMAPSNTGMPSGFDLDNSGEAVTEFPPPPAEGQTDEGRAYGNDCWGFGTFPGQYAMALLVDPRLEIVAEDIRTFRLMPWDYMPGAFLPEDPETGEPWFDEEERKLFRLSSKSHWDVPVRLPNGAVVHMLCSHPTPPAFDGPEMRNKKRNYDEIRFWADYLAGDSYIVDDANVGGGLREGAPFVILGDLNADPEGTGFKNPMETLLLSDPRVDASVAPIADVEMPRLDASDTASWRKRVDYVLPSQVGVEVLRAGVYRSLPVGTSRFPSDHFPVWADLRFSSPTDR